MSTVQVKLGAAVLGEWRGAARRPAMPAWERQAKQRRNSLSRLIKYRRENGLAIGSDEAWAAVLANTLAALRQPADAMAVAAFAARLGLNQLDTLKVEGMVIDTEQARRIWGGYRLRTPAQVAAMLDVTSVERADCSLRDIAAVDESDAERGRRLARQRQSRRRAKGADGKSATQAQMAAEDGVSLSTWKRRKALEPKSVTLSDSQECAHARVSPARVKSVTANGSPNGGAHA